MFRTHNYVSLTIKRLNFLKQLQPVMSRLSLFHADGARTAKSWEEACVVALRWFNLMPSTLVCDVFSWSLKPTAEQSTRACRALHTNVMSAYCRCRFSNSVSSFCKRSASDKSLPTSSCIPRIILMNRFWTLSIKLTSLRKIEFHASAS